MTRLMLLAVCALILASCTTRVLTPIPDDERDRSGRFNGRWDLVQQRLKGRQIVGGEYFNCTFSGRRTAMYVFEGVARVRYAGREVEGNVAEDGRFRIEIPSDREYRYARGISAPKSGITYIFQGRLGDDEDGLFVTGKESLNNSGCSTPLKIVDPRSVKNSFDPGNPETKKVVGRWMFADTGIPRVSSPSRLSTVMNIERDGEHFTGELDITMTATPACGELVSRSTTPIVASLDGDRLVVTFTDATPDDEATCGDARLAARRYLRKGKLVFAFAEDDGGAYLKFRERCGWHVDGECVYSRPLMRQVGG